MRRREVCAFSVLLLAMPIFFSPVRAHTTLGNLISIPPYHTADSDPHVPGPTVYLWPSAGEGAYLGSANGASGYVDPYSSNANFAPGANLGYSPSEGILTSTTDHENVGPLILAINFTNPCAFGWNDVDNTCGRGDEYMENFTGLTVYIPPEFDLSNIAFSYHPGLIQTTFAANSNDVAAISQASRTDPWGPGWWIVSMNGDLHWWPQHDYREWYYMRINGVGAPKIAGKYFFKVFLFDQFFNFDYPGMTRNPNVNGYECGACNQGTAANPSRSLVPSSGATNATVPVENWPVVLVKGEIDPAIITGTIRYGSYNQSLYGNPVNLAGRVRAVGVALDPYDLNLQSTARQVEARGYFNESAMGHFEVEGVAPGVYDLYASAAGYPEQLISSGLVILSGQSLHLDGYIKPGPVVEGQVFSKHLFGDQPWPTQARPVFVEVYRNDDYTDDNAVLASPLNLTHQPYMAYDWDYFAPNPSVPTPRPVAFPWEANSAMWGGSYYGETFHSPAANPNYNSHPAIACGGAVDVCGRPNGVGPAQYWWVDSGGVFTNGGGSSSFIFRFGEQGLYGAPTELDGHVPQTFASWVDGLVAGQYWVRVWINGYVQTELDGVTTNIVRFEVTGGEWAGDVYVPIDIRLSSSIEILAHFHDQPHTLQECPIDGCSGNTAMGLARGNRYLIAELRDSSGSLVGMNFSYVLATQSSAMIEINGFGMIGPDTPGLKYSYYNYEDYRDYGISAGTYEIYLYMRGYLQDQIQPVSVALSGNPTIVSTHLHRGARLNVTLYSVDWERPRVQRPWEFPGAQIRLYVADATGRLFGYVGYTALGLAPDREAEPARQPACYMRSPTPPYCPTGIPQVVAPTDPFGSTIVVESWDGYSAAEVDTPGLPPSQLQFGGGYAPNWDIGGFLIYPYEYRFDQSDNFTAIDALRTGTYYPYGLTYGYVQRNDFPIYAVEGGEANTEVNLLKGVNLTMRIVFTKEGDLAPTEFNMSMRVRVFDQYGNLVATSSSKSPDTASLRADLSSSSFFGLGRFSGANIDPATTISESYYPDPFTPSPTLGSNPQSTSALTSIAADHSADGFLWYGTWQIGVAGAPITGWQGFDSDPAHNGVSDFATFQGNSNFWGLEEWKTTIPYDTKEVRVFLAGIYDVFGDTLDYFGSGLLHTRSWKTDHGEPVESMYYGIIGNSVNPSGYGGPWSVEVDCWNEYPKPQAGPGVAPPTADWYPPVDGLLQGDSFHIIPSPEGDSFGFVGSTMSANGLGPYGQNEEWLLPNAPLGTEVSGVFSLAEHGYVSGQVDGFDRFGALDTLSWAGVEANSTMSNVTFTQQSWDGHFEMYLPPGTYALHVSEWDQSSVGYTASNSIIQLGAGEVITGLEVILERSGIPLQNDVGSMTATLLPIAMVLTYARKRRHARKVARRLICILF